MRKILPIYDIEDEFLCRLKTHSRLIIEAPTGSGKSTQIPQILLKNGYLDKGQAVILQPRRLAARLLAARVAEEQGCALGQEVGYQIRFENRTRPNTRIRYVTEGVLMRQMLTDPELKGVSVLVFDEFHERHLYGDISLAQALTMQERLRPDLKIVVMSATLNTALLKTYLAQSESDQIDVGIITSEGRMYPVEVRYADRASWDMREPVWELAAEAFRSYIHEGGEGDVLVFMPGAYEIQQTIRAIENCKESSGFIILPLHGELQGVDQDAAVARYQKRKVVVATNVAETSLTIDGVRLVIDSGLARIPRFDPYRGINTLMIEKISQASAEQRKGRAGRTAEGVCMRLWSETEHQDRLLEEKPEVQRMDLSEVVLTLKSSGVDDLNQFRWLEHPGDQRLANAVELLSDLGALAKGEGGRANITDLGRRMLAFPLDPRYSRMLIEAEKLGCVYQACMIASLTQGKDLLLRKLDRHTRETREDLLGHQADSDFFILMRAFAYANKNQFRLDACKKIGLHAQSTRQVGPLFQQFLRIAKDEGLEIEPKPVSDEILQRCILAGFTDRIAHRVDSGSLRCELVHHRKGTLAKESLVQSSPLFVASEIREIGQHDGEVRTLLSMVTAIKQEWLMDLYPDEFLREIEVFFDAQARRVFAEEICEFRGLELESKKVEPPPLDAASRILAEQVVQGKLILKHWDHSVEQWIVRLNCLAQWCPDLELPSLDEEAKKTLLEQICHGAFTYKEIKDRQVKPLLQQWLNSEQMAALTHYAPERLTLSNNRTPKVVYENGKPPSISLRIQELFGVEHIPAVAMGRVQVLVHILAPNMRDVQVTQDLKSFWRDHYPSIKSELQRKYPKHQWM